MKKGFTLVEIIISISLILIIGVSAVVFILRNKSNNQLELVTNQILEAANLYIKIEVDNSGKSYNEIIQQSPQGVAITIEQLVKKGYIEKKEADEIYEKNPGLGSNQDYYVLFINGGKGLNDYKKEYCETGQITILPSWVEKTDEPIYLCENKKECPTCETPQTFVEKLKSQSFYYGFSDGIGWGRWILPESERFYGMTHSMDLQCFGDGGCAKAASETVFRVYNTVENGLFYNNNSNQYVYSGEVDNNHVRIFGWSFNIVSFNEHEIKLIQNGKKFSNSFDQETLATLKKQTSFDPKYKSGSWVYTATEEQYNLFKKQVLSNYQIDLEKGYLLPVRDSKYFSLITNDELLEAGIIPSYGSQLYNIADDSDGGNYFSTICPTSNLYISRYATNKFSCIYMTNSYIGKSSTFTYSGGYITGKHIEMSNNKEKMFILKGAYAPYTTIASSNYHVSDTLNNIIDNAWIRFVIMIDPDKIESYEGDGTESNPYNLEFKST